MDEMVYDIVEIGGGESVWSDDLFYLNLDPIYLKLQKFRNAVDGAERNLRNGFDEFKFYMKSKSVAEDNAIDFWERVPDLRPGGDTLSLEISRWNIYKGMLELAFRKAEDDLIKAEKEASCITDLIAKESWRAYEKRE